MRSRGLYFVTAALLLLLFMEIGCMIPTKLPNRIHGFGGGRLQKRDVDSTFITIGLTRRDEVAARLAAIDTGSPKQFFWGRWAESSWGVVGAVVTDLDPSDVMMGGSARHWHFHNLLVKFDEQGIAQEKLAIDNDEQLWQQLLAYSRHLPAAPTPEVIRLPSTEKKYTEIVLAADSIQFRGAKPKDDMVLPLPSPAVIHLRPHFWGGLERPVENCYGLEVESASTSVKRGAGFCATGQQLAQIVAYLDHLPAPARWEER